MFIILFGKPLVFWLGLMTLVSFIVQVYTGYKVAHGRSDYFKYHKINIVILCTLVLIHLTLGLLMYI